MEDRARMTISRSAWRDRLYRACYWRQKQRHAAQVHPENAPLTAGWYRRTRPMNPPPLYSPACAAVYTPTRTPTRRRLRPS